MSPDGGGSVEASCDQVRAGARVRGYRCTRTAGERCFAHTSTYQIGGHPGRQASAVAAESYDVIATRTASSKVRRRSRPTVSPSLSGDNQSCSRSIRPE